MTTPVNLAKLKQIFAKHLTMRIPYKLGGKAASLSSDPPKAGIDCSGEARILIYQATDGAVALPDGSWNQRAWCEANLEEVSYETALKANEGELFIAFITAHVNGSGGVGHVWLVLGQKAGTDNTTLESRGGKGIDSRRADTPVLLREVHKCFRVPTNAAQKPVAAPVVATVADNRLYINDVLIEGAQKVGGAWMVPLRAAATAGGMKLFQQQSGPGERWSFYK